MWVEQKAWYASDVNKDGELTVADIVSLRKIIMTSEYLRPDLFALADVDNDGEITVTDIIALRNNIMKK